MPLTQEQIYRQRFYLYSQISNILSVAKFRLILPVHQLSMSAAGYCHGYAEYWQAMLLPSVVERRYSWDKLLAKQPYDFAELKLNTEIIKAQAAQNLQYQQRTYTNNVTQQIEFMARKIFASTDLPQYFTFAMAKMPWSFLAAEYCYVNSWHQLRLCRDAQGYIHIFDANCGWFKSLDNDCSQQELTLFLSRLFLVLQYPENYDIIAQVYPVTRLTCAAALHSCRARISLQ